MNDKKTCPYCKMDIPAGAVRCPYCQADIRPKVEDKPLTIVLAALVLGAFVLGMLILGVCIGLYLFGG